jgi:hypothetical protein
MLFRFFTLFVFLSSSGFASQLEESDALPASNPAQAVEPGKSNDPLITAADIVQRRQETTIGASVSKANGEYEGGETLESLQAALKLEEDLSDLAGDDSSAPGLQTIGIASFIEFVASVIVLSFVFPIFGHPVTPKQLFALGFAVALFGAILHTLLAAGPLHPVRAVTGLVVLTPLIRQFTAVRTWTGALGIALATRLISLGLIWLTAIALTAIGSL